MDFFVVGWALKSDQAPPQGIQGVAAPWMDTNFQSLKRFQILEKESILHNYQHFLAIKTNSLRITSKPEQILQAFLNLFKRLIYNFKILWSAPINPQKGL